MPSELERTRPPALAPSTHWQAVLAAYLDAAIDSPHTRRAYTRHITAALEALDVPSLTDLTGAMLAAWRAHVTGSTLSPASQSQALAALRSFLRWAGTFGAHSIPPDVIREALRTPRATVTRPYHVLSDPEAARLLSAAENLRDRALVALLLGAGLRAAELVALDVDDLHEDGDGETVLHIRAGKGRKDRVVPIRDDAARAVRRYLAASRRSLGDPGPLLLSEDRARRSPDRRLSTRAVGYLVARLCERAEIDAKRISPHSIRHTYAIRALRHRATVPAVQKLLGHASVATTSRYLDHLELAELRAAVPTLPDGDSP
jgi:site-specific recombinase XerD